MTRLPNAAPKPTKRPKKVRKPIRRSRVRQKAGKPKRFSKRRDPEYLAWIRERPCACRGLGLHVCMDGIEAAHLRSRGAGGSDRENLIPLCRLAHWQQHREGITSWATRRFGSLDALKQLAQQYTERYDRERSVG